MCLGQTAGYGALIFKIFSWDVMEPITYLTSAFYACVGTGFYLKYREDFEIGSVWDAMKNRKFNQLVKKNQLDEEKVEFLKRYVDDLQQQINHLQI